MNRSTTGNDIVATLRQSLALPPPKPSGGQATRRIITGSDGRPYVQFVDIATGQPISDLTGYEILESGDGRDWTSAILDQEARSVLGDLGPEVVNQIGDDQPSQTEQAFRLRNGGEGSGATSRLTSGPRTARDNFGYLDTPKALEYGNMVPGPIGTLSKLANTAINANNVSAVEAARTHVGLPGLDKGQVAGGLVGTNDYDDGLVADAVINDRVYGIGLEALTPDGRTSLTPEEARKRSETAPSRARLATDQENAQNRKQFQAENPSTSIKGVIQNAGKSLGKALGWSQAETEKTVQSSLKAVETAEYQGKPMRLQSDAPMPPSARRNSEPPKGRSLAYGSVDARPDQDPRNQVDSRQKANISYADLGPAKNRPNRPDLEVVDRVRESVAKAAPGVSVNVTSGGGEYGSDRHRAHNRNGGMYQAMDFSLVDEKTGRTLTMAEDRGTFQAIAEEMAAHGVKGIGEYGSQNFFHADIVQEGAWGPKSTSASLAPDIGEAISRGRQRAGDYTYQSSIPTPVDRQTALAMNEARQPANATEAIEQATVQPQREPSNVSSLAPSTGIERRSLPGLAAPQNSVQTASLGPTASDVASMSPASLSNRGYGPSRSLEDRQRIAATLAGELHGDTLKGIQAGDPEAISEAANVISTIENRAQSQRYASLADPIGSVLGPSNYNANYPGNAVQAKNNQTFGQELMGFVEDYYQGRVQPSMPGATHYYNPGIVEPSWGAKLEAPQTVGYHTFGSLTGEFPEAQSTIDARTRYQDDRTPNPDRAAPLGRVERSSLQALDPSELASSRIQSAFDRTSSSGFAGPMGSYRANESRFGNLTADRGDRVSDNGISDRINGAFDTTRSSGFAGSMGSFRSQEGRDGGIGNSPMADRGGRVGPSSGFAGGMGSARSQNADNDTYDGRSEGSGASRSSSGGFAGSAGSARSANQNNSSFDGSGSSSKGSGGFAGSSGSGRSANQGNDSYDGGGSQRSSSGFAGNAGSARSVEGSQKGSSGGLNTDNAKGMSERSKDDGVGSGKSGSGTGSWR